MKALNKVKCVYAMMLVVLLTGCAASRHGRVPIVSRRDSVAILVQRSLVYHPILAELDIPDIRETITTRDTASRLENDYAESTATISNGMLTHSLKTKPHTESVEVNAPHERTDTTIYIYQDVVKIKEVEKPLSWWQETQIRAFWAMLSILAVIILWRLFRSKFGGLLGSILNLFK